MRSLSVVALASSACDGNHPNACSSSTSPAAAAWSQGTFPDVADVTAGVGACAQNAVTLNFAWSVRLHASIVVTSM